MSLIFGVFGGIRLVRNKVEKSPVDRVAVLIISLILIGLRKLAGQ